MEGAQSPGMMSSDVNTQPSSGGVSGGVREGAKASPPASRRKASSSSGKLPPDAPQDLSGSLDSLLSPPATPHNPASGRKRQGSDASQLRPESPLAMAEEAAERTPHTPLAPGAASPKVKEVVTGSGSPTHVSRVFMSKTETLKAQKRHYRDEKKKAARELLGALKDPGVIVMADWLKVRGTLKGWTKLWCVLKPGLIVLYKSQKQKSGTWVGTIMLNMCELIERPSKKDGFCFKVFHPLDQSVWAARGPEGETIGAITQPLPASYIIFRAPSESAGKTWMDALELSLRCSNLLTKTMNKEKSVPFNLHESPRLPPASSAPLLPELPDKPSFVAGGFRRGQTEPWAEADYEKHFCDHELGDEGKDDRSDSESRSGSESRSEDEEEEEEGGDVYPGDRSLPSGPLVETQYVKNEAEELGQLGDSCQTEEVNDDNKSIIWSLVKQVRPGMDLSKVVLPTFILEPRSLLDKLSDYYYHADYISAAVQEDDPFTRLKHVTRWYVSGFYKKPRGLKKPYNPILGETFRCTWQHPSGTRTFYIAEQISHHPPVTAFYVTNRQEGFCISGSLLAKSKFYGNSVSAIMDGVGKLTLLPRGEDYVCTMPYANCKGILVGTLTMEMGGKVSISCDKTGYRADMEFKLKRLFSGSENANRISGKMKLGSETLATLSGHWDGRVTLTDAKTGVTETFFEPTPEVRGARLTRYTVPLECQQEFESERLWRSVSCALARGDDRGATEGKHGLEDAQRRRTKERELQGVSWAPRLFDQDNSAWLYRYADSRPWDAMNDVYQYERDFVVKTQTKHRTPLVRALSVISVTKPPPGPAAGEGESRGAVVRRQRRRRSAQRNTRESGSSGHEPNTPSDASDLTVNKALSAPLQKALLDAQTEWRGKLAELQTQLATLQSHPPPSLSVRLSLWDWAMLGVLLCLQATFFSFFLKAG